ncbi:MAG: DUF1828 domain-containing protein [Lactobacillales bacterium]|jgi:hypothetical protein|nr:DUF1828 domain-containing protein [Lactobacillales bacterium]
MSTDLKTKYLDFLSDEISYKEINNHVMKITFPFLEEGFDSLNIYAETKGGNMILLTDNGWTMDNLKSRGLMLDSQPPKKKLILEEILATFCVEIDKQEEKLVINTDIEKYALSKHRLLQAILKVNHLASLADVTVKTAFHELIYQKLVEKGILFTDKPSFIGKGGMLFPFDFAIPTRNHKEILIRTIGRPNDLSQSKLLARDAALLKNTKTAEFYVIIDDLTQPFTIEKELQTLFTEKKKPQIHCIKLSELDEKIERLLNE